MRPYTPKLILALVFMIWAAGMTAAFAVMIEPVIDDVLSGQNLDLVWFLAAAIFFIFFSRGIATYIHTVLMNSIGQFIVSDVQKDMFGHFMQLDLTFFHDNPSGQLISRIVNDVNAMRNAVTDSLTGIGKSFLTLIMLVGVMFYQDWVLALAAFCIFPLAAGFVYWIGRRLRKMSGRIQEDLAGLSDILSQIFQGIRLVKAYGMEDHEKRRTAITIEKVRDYVVKAVRVANLSTPVNEALVGVVVFGIVVYGGYQVSEGHTTAGELLSFITAFSLAYEPMKRLAKLNNSLQMGLGAADRIFDVMDLSPKVFNDDNARLAKFDRPDITFRDVSFQYHDDERKALDDISFTIPAGKTTALVGPSGSGKTTIINLIPRLFDVGAGNVLLDGTHIKEFSLESLRQNIAFVSQDITIFDDSVWANIGYSKPEASQEEIIDAAKAAEAHEFIESLPQGYDTQLGEEGLKLSGGQRQRIAIARAILRDAPILLLDEATSALDNEVELAIQNTLNKLQEGRTTLVIAHRLSTVKNAHQILVLEEGRLSESGNHEDLIKLNGVYARIYQAGLRE